MKPSFISNFILKSNYDPYLTLQRNRNSSDKQLLLNSYYKDYKMIASFLPSNVTQILDIGCGLAISDVFLFNHYKADKLIKFYLFDKTGISHNLHFGFSDKPSYYNSLYLAYDLCLANGMASQQIIPMNATKENLTDLKNVDLVVSFIAWGFHFPVDTYLDEVYNLLAPNGRLIIDIRKGTDGLEKLQIKFGQIKIINEGKKVIRVCCIKTNDK